MAPAMVIMNTAFTNKRAKHKKTKPANISKVGRNARGRGDWRKFAHSGSTSTDSIEKAVTPKVEDIKPTNSGLSDDNSLLIRTGNSNDVVASPVTAEGVVPGEDINSAQGHKVESSPEVTLDVTHVKVIDLTCVDIVRSGGHTATLPTTFAVDFRPIDQASLSAGGSPSLPIGEMKRVTNPQHLCSSMEEADIDQTRDALGFPPRYRLASTKSGPSCHGADTERSILLKEQDAAALMKADPAIDRIGGVKAQSPHRAKEVDQAARDRFRHMLERLTQGKPSTSDVAVADLGSSTVTRHQASEHNAMVDSGYDSPDDINQAQSGSGHALGIESPSKRLNPMALEFKVPGETKPPVTSSRPHTNSSSSGTDSSAQYQAQYFGPTPEPSPLLSNYNSVNVPGYVVPATFPVHGRGTMAPPMPSTSLSMALLNNLYGSNSMMSTIPTTNHYPNQMTSVLPNVGTFPSSATPTTALPVMANGFRSQSAPISGYPWNTAQTEYPTAPFQQLSMPLSMLAPQGYNAASQYPTTGTYGAAAMGFAPSTGSTNPLQMPLPLINPVPRRFPVTQKPRDNNPFTQQMYEEYLEYRKSFEPGFHEAARKRQMERYARQNA